jgi:hypothetical protein
MAEPRRADGAQSDPVTSPPRVEIAPGIFAESVVKRAGADVSQVYRVTGGVFDRFEVDSMSSLASLVGILSSFGSDELRSLAEEPTSGDELLPPTGTGHRGGLRAPLDDLRLRRCEVELPAEAPAATAHRRFNCDPEAARRARIWAAETLGDCLPDTDWSVAMLEHTVLRAGELVAEAVDSGAAAVLVTLEIDGRRLFMTRFDELQGGLEQAAAR